MSSSIYNWLDEKLGGILPGAVPLGGGERDQGSDPESAANKVANANSTATDKNNTNKETKTSHALRSSRRLLPRRLLPQ